MSSLPPAPERASDLERKLSDKCSSFGLPTSFDALMRHLENNHAAVVDVQRSDIESLERKLAAAEEETERLRAEWREAGTVRADNAAPLYRLPLPARLARVPSRAAVEDRRATGRGERAVSATRTTRVDSRLQSCFTTRMAATTLPRRRETVYDKAERILQDPSRVVVSEQSCPPQFVTATVLGDSGEWHAAFAVAQEFMDRHGLSGGRVGCTCRAGRRRVLCSHALVAEEMRLR